MQAVNAYEDFEAIHDHMPGSEHVLRVTGTVVFATSGWSCELRETSGNNGINQLMLSLDLVLEGPPEGSTVSEVLTPCPVEWQTDNPAIDYKQVQFHVNTDDPPPPVIDVIHPTTQ
jgi:hypothetical protein